MTIELFNQEDVKMKGRTIKFADHIRAVKNVREELWDMINKSKDKQIIVRINDIAEELDLDYNNENNFVQAMHFAFWNNGIGMKTCRLNNENEDRAFVLWNMTNKDDWLPESLSKHLLTDKYGGCVDLADLV